jgi:hypothetical protein
MRLNKFKELYYDYAEEGQGIRFAKSLTITISEDGYLMIQYGADFVPLKKVKNDTDMDWDEALLDTLAFIIKGTNRHDTKSV